MAIAYSKGAAAAVGIIVLGVVYLYRINSIMKVIPKLAMELSPRRWTREEVMETYDRVSKTPIDFTKHLPPMLARKYVVVGGSGHVGGDIVLQLLQRGHDPQSIRIVDFRPPSRDDMVDRAAGCDYAQADISSPASVESAFSKPWPTSVAGLPLTVFHTAAAIRPSERNRLFLDRVWPVNVDGTANVLASSRKAGADIFIATSSASVAVTPVSFWVWPWRREPVDYAQIVDEADFDLPLRPHDRFFANYAYSKAKAERLVCGANEDGFRTGTIRPGNGVYGQKNDQLVGNCLAQGDFVSWIPHVIQNFVSGRNIALAHLLFEAALARPEMPPCAGRPFVITDKGPSPSFNDLYQVVTQTSVTPTSVTFVPPVSLLILAHALECWCLTLKRLPFLTTVLGWREPSGPIHNLQPAVFSISAHTIVNDAAARRSVVEGGIGYRGACTALEGMCEQMADWNREHDKKEQ